MQRLSSYLTLQHLILTQESRASERRNVLVDVESTEASDAELVRMIECRSRKGEVDREELEPATLRASAGTTPAGAKR